MQPVNNLRRLRSKNVLGLPMHTKSKKKTPYWGVEKEIIVFLMNEGWNRECCHGNKMLYILELLSSCFITVKVYFILTSNVWTAFDLNIKVTP